MFTDYAEWEHLKSLGIEEWILRQKNEGRISNIGFSYHGDTEMFLWSHIRLYNSSVNERDMNVTFEKSSMIFLFLM